jgi:hypothetical protein
MKRGIDKIGDKAVGYSQRDVAKYLTSPQELASAVQLAKSKRINRPLSKLL